SCTSRPAGPARMRAASGLRRRAACRCPPLAGERPEPKRSVLVDTHCHLADAAFAGDAREAVDRAAAAGVGHVVVVGESPEAAAAALALAAEDRRVSATAGVHPHVASRWDAATADWL